jgi:site-specific recombinase XerD
MQNSQISIFTHYRPAELKEGKEWYISYYVLNPYKNTLERKRIKVNRITSITERRKYAKRLVLEINNKLQSGWNPFLEKNAPKSFTKINDLLDIFINARVREKLNEDSIRSYKSQITKFKKWLTLVGKDDIYIINFKKTDAINYVNYQFYETNIKNVTYNNLLQWCNLLFNWFVNNGYTNNNPFHGFKKKKEEEKERTTINIIDRNKLKQHLETENPNFLTLCMLMFGSLIRPKEISFLKKEYFNLKNQTITLPAHITKNKKKRITTIPNSNIPYLVDFFTSNNIPDNYYLFGSGCQPNIKRTHPKRYGEIWRKVRKKLNFPDNYVLYSLRDSGIIQLIQDGVSAEEVMKLADHSSLEITSVYVKHANPNGSEQVKNKSRGF